MSPVLVLVIHTLGDNAKVLWPLCIVQCVTVGFVCCPAIRVTFAPAHSELITVPAVPVPVDRERAVPPAIAPVVGYGIQYLRGTKYVCVLEEGDSYTESPSGIRGSDDSDTLKGSIYLSPHMPPQFVYCNGHSTGCCLPS